jgi:aerobic-type carbon monoxide dehydrogenase small subunit (CoxS/CutS family)
MSVTVQFTLNGETVRDTVSPDLSLANYLAEDRNLTGTRICCGIGVCHACTVAVKAKGAEVFEATRACITPVSILNEAQIQTPEGLAKGDQLHPLQTAFLKHFSFQCGYSTSGFLMGAYALLDKLAKNPIATSQIDEAILEAVGDNICRCTGYFRYYEAIKETILSTPGLTKG